MIHKEILFGYEWDSYTNTIHSKDLMQGYGLFSSFTLLLMNIIGVYKQHNVVVENINTKNALCNFKWDESIDLYHYFFKIDKSVNINFSEPLPDFLNNPDQQHFIYKSENLKYFLPFFKRFFSPSDVLLAKINYLKQKYNIDSNNSVSVIVRDSDKWTDFGGFISTSAGSYMRYTRDCFEQMHNKTGNKPDILIQSENPGIVKHFFCACGIAPYVKFIEETALDKDQSSYPPIVSDINKKKDWLESYIAALWIHSQSNTVVTYTGNSGFFVYLMRGNTNNFIQEKTFQFNHKEFFAENA